MSRPGNLFKFDFLRSSRVQFSMTGLPNIFPASYKRAIDFRDIIHMCESLEFPGKSLSTIDFAQAGFNRAKIPVLRNYPEITLTFLLPRDDSLPLYQLFTDWVELAAPRDNTVPYYDDIVLRQGIKLTQYRDTGKKEYTVVLFNAYPMSVTSVQGNWGDNDVSKLVLNLTFEDFKFEDRLNAVREARLQESLDQTVKETEAQISREADRLLKLELDALTPPNFKFDE